MADPMEIMDLEESTPMEGAILMMDLSDMVKKQQAHG
jgi:hypothetical protein